MNFLKTDTVILGDGTAGLAAYRAARAAGKTALLVEGGPYGTTCARVGCMPSKLLIAAAEAAHNATQLEPFGLHLEGRVRVDGAAVMQRVQRERDRFVGFVLEGIEALPEQYRIRGYARFTGPRSVEVDGHTHIDFGTAVIATGSSAQVLPFLKPAGKRLLINDDVFEWETLPRSLALFGPGVIGLELGQALSRLGVQVHLFGKGGIGAGLSDPAVRAQAQGTFANEFTLDLDAEVTSLQETPEGVAIRWRDPQGQSRSATFDYVLAATGRTPNVHRLDLHKTGVVLDQKGVPLFDRQTLQCGQDPIFIAGDANAESPLLHEAADEGRIAGENAALYPNVRPGLRKSPLAVVFTDPQIALVGQRYVEIPDETRVVGEVSFENQGRSRVMLKNKGLLRVYAQAGSGRFLGAEMLATAAEHLAHLLAWAHQNQMTVQSMLQMPFYHPVIEEGLRTALREAQSRLH